MAKVFSDIHGTQYVMVWEDCADAWREPSPQHAWAVYEIDGDDLVWAGSGKTQEEAMELFAVGEVVED